MASIDNSQFHDLAGTSDADTLDGTVVPGFFDALHGGLGNDTYRIDFNAGSFDLVVEAPGAGSDTVQIGSSQGEIYILAANVENATALGPDNTGLTGTALANVLLGNGGINFIDGGNDVLNAGAGIDLLFGDVNGVIGYGARGGNDILSADPAGTIGGPLSHLDFTVVA